jgi:hypothetical protein
MQMILSVLFEVAFEPIVRVSSAALAPVLADLALDKTQLKDLVLKVGANLQKQTVTYAPMGIYSAAEQKEIVEGLSDIVSALLVKYGITQTADIGRLLSAVAAKIAV